MNETMQERRDYGFVIGLLTGTFVGAGLTMWLAPRVANEIRERVTDKYRLASARVGETIDELTERGNGVRDDVASAVARGAHEVERFAKAAKSDRT
jgi:gas vesicle protein